jgi:mediator of RNA polymerase II transcription subunit 5
LNACSYGGELTLCDQGDIQNLTIDLIVASFDVLAAAVERHESSEQIFALKSFHTNKIPVLISALSSSMFLPLTQEFCINQAMSHVDLTIFPAPSYGMMSNSPVQDVRQEFLFACVLHSLLPADSIEGLLGESPFTSPPSPERRYTKEGLLQQTSGNGDRLSELIKELENLDGNAGAIVSAVVDVRQDTKMIQTVKLNADRLFAMLALPKTL